MVPPVQNTSTNSQDFQNQMLTMLMLLFQSLLLLSVISRQTKQSRIGQSLVETRRSLNIGILPLLRNYHWLLGMNFMTQIQILSSKHLLIHLSMRDCMPNYFCALRVRYSKIWYHKNIFVSMGFFF
jgi:hypothetical protein